MMTNKPDQKKQKPGPEPERLVITEDPEEALLKLLKPQGDPMTNGEDGGWIGGAPMRINVSAEVIEALNQAQVSAGVTLASALRGAINQFRDTLPDPDMIPITHNGNAKTVADGTVEVGGDLRKRISEISQLLNTSEAEALSCILGVSN